ncbi:MAG: class B sortase [Saccharofermentans sp.]|nr:class B sortase [Saccharofermentans sp.]
MKRRTILKLIIVLSIIILIFCGAKIISLNREEYMNKQGYDKLQVLRSDTIVPDSIIIDLDYDGDNDMDPVREYLMDLYNINHDFRGWLNISDTTIDFPIVQGWPEDPEHYLHYDFYNAPNTFGCPFIAAGDTIEADNIVIYGHHFRNGNMFAPLDNYLDQTWADDHRYITLEALDKTHTYQVFCVFRMEVVDRPFHWDSSFLFPEEDDFNDFIANCNRYNEIETDFVPEYGDNFITLVTCNYSYSNGRLVIIACEYVT